MFLFHNLNRYPSIIWLLTLTLSFNGYINAGPISRQNVQSSMQYASTKDSSTMKSEEAIKQQAAEQYGKLPLSFEANEGQTDERVKFLSRGMGYTLFLTSNAEAVLSLQNSQGDKEDVKGKEGAIIRMKMVGARDDLQVNATGQMKSKTNYLEGSDQQKWRHASMYERVKYKEVYAGIDVEYYGNQGQLEYDFIVSEGADTKNIKIGIEGADRVEINTEGELVLGIEDKEVKQHKPVIFEEKDGKRKEIEGKYVKIGEREVGFEIGEYDKSAKLIIDPVLVYSSYIGGLSANDPYAGTDYASCIEVDESGNAYVAGQTGSIDFPKTTGAYNATSNRYGGAFVTKFNSIGSDLIYSTVIDQSSVAGLAVDSLGNAYITGYGSPYYHPITPGAYNKLGIADSGVFVTKLNATGSDLVYSAFLGKGYSRGLVVDSMGNTYITGHTYDSSYPTTSGAYDTRPDSEDAFVTKLNAEGNDLVYSTFVGGTSLELAAEITIDVAGNAYITGRTYSSDFPATSGAYDTTYNGRDDAFITKINSTGSSLVYSTFLGGTSDEYSSGIAIDSLGNAYLTGYTFSSDFPTTAGAYSTRNNGHIDAFVSKIDSTGSSLIYSTFLGGSVSDYSNGINVDSSGSAYVVGWSESYNFPVTAYAGTSSSSIKMFVTKLNPSGTGLIYSSGIAASFYPSGNHFNTFALDKSGNVYITGSLVSAYTYPTSMDAYDRSFDGYSDVFVTKLNSSGGYAYSTFLGGKYSSGEDQSNSIAIDKDGYAYIIGSTTSFDFPTTSNTYDRTLSGSKDVFIVKIDKTGSNLVYLTYLGGSDVDIGYSIKVNSSGEAYLVGGTTSSNFPTTPGSYDTTYNGNDVFVTKLNASGSALIYSTYVGTVSIYDECNIAIDTSDNAYITGSTRSPGYPTTPGSYDTTYNYYDLFVTKLNATGTGLVYSTYLGGGDYTMSRGIAVDSLGNAYITGDTQSSNFPTTPGAYDTSFNSSIQYYADVFVTKLNPTGTGLVYSSYLGGAEWDRSEAIAIDGSGNAYITGFTPSLDFPITPGAYDTSFNGVSNIYGNFGNSFVAKLDSSGSNLAYSTFLDEGVSKDIGVDGSDNAYIIGSISYPTYYSSVFVKKLNKFGNKMIYSTLLGKTYKSFGNAIAVDKSGYVYITGYTDSAKFPVTRAAYDTSINGTVDAFISKLYLGDSIAHSQSIATSEDTSVGITVTGITSSENDPNYTVVSQPSHGSLSGSVPNLSYTPDPNYFGSDSFSFTVSNGSNTSSPATISISVSPVNDPPSAFYRSIRTTQNSSTSFTIKGYDIDGDTLSYSILSPPSYGYLSGSLPYLSYTPSPDFSGSDSFIFKVSDGKLDSSPATVSISVVPSNASNTSSRSEKISWTNLSIVSAFGNTLSKSSSVGNAGAASNKAILSGDGYIEFTATETSTHRMCALSHGDPGQTYQELDFAIYLTPNRRLIIYEKGSYIGDFGSYSTGDSFRVAVESNLIKYYKNNSILYTSSKTPTYPLIADTWLYSNGATITDAMIVGNLARQENISWTNLSGVSSSNNSLTKTGSSDNAGASSNYVILSGDGYVEFTASETTSHRMLALSNIDKDQSYEELGFAIYLTSSGYVIIYEKGTYIRSFSTYSTGDIFKISVESGLVKYYQNEKVFYTSKKTPTYPLLADTWLYNNGATITNTVIGGNIGKQDKVSWTNAVKASSIVNSLTGTGNNGGASSKQAIMSGDGYVEFIASETASHRMCGLSNRDTDQTYEEIGYAIYLTSSGRVIVYEAGTYMGDFGPYQTEDRFRVAIESGSIKYYKNGLSFYTSRKTPVYPLVADTWLYTAGATITEAMIAGNIVDQENVTWSNAVGVISTGNSLSKTGTGENAGAASTKGIISGDGYAEFTATEATSHRMCGLSNGDSGQTYGEINFAIYVTSNGEVIIYEEGNYIDRYGRYVEGDRFRIGVETGEVKYYKNGKIIYTSKRQPTYPLRVDTWIYTTGGTITDVVIGGNLSVQ
jgi:hypothetical protein